MPTQKLTAEIIAAAILGFEQQKHHIDTKIAELRAMLPGGSTGTEAGQRNGKKAGPQDGSGPMHQPGTGGGTGGGQRRGRR